MTYSADALSRRPLVSQFLHEHALYSPDLGGVRSAKRGQVLIEAGEPLIYVQQQLGHHFGRLHPEGVRSSAPARRSPGCGHLGRRDDPHPSKARATAPPRRRGGAPAVLPADVFRPDVGAAPPTARSRGRPEPAVPRPPARVRGSPDVGPARPAFEATLRSREQATSPRRRGQSPCGAPDRPVPAALREPVSPLWAPLKAPQSPALALHRPQTLTTPPPEL